MDRRNYIEILSEQIRCKKALPLVTEELEDHIEEQKKDFMAEGMTEREAEEAAVREMGDPVEVGVDMDRIHRPKMNFLLMAFVGIMNLLGIAVLYFTNHHIVKNEVLYRPLSVYIFYAVVGFAIMTAVCYVDYTRIAYRAKEILIFGIFLIVAGEKIFETQVNGTHAVVALPIGDIIMNTRMVQMLFIPVYCAILYSYRGQGYSGFFKGVSWIIPILAVMVYDSNITEAIIIFLPVFAVILSFAVYKEYFRVSKRKVLSGIWGAMVLIPAICAAIIWKWGAVYQSVRLKMILNPEKYAQEGSYQFFQIRKLLEGSRFVGRSAGFSEAVNTVPDSGSLVLAHITAYAGVLAAAAIIGIILLLMAKLIAITMRQKNQLGMIMGLGCGLVLLSHIFWYVLVNMGVMIPGYVYCPFLVCGGSGMIVTYILFGVMLSVYRHQNVLRAEVPVAERMFVRRKCRE